MWKNTRTFLKHASFCVYACVKSSGFIKSVFCHASLVWWGFLMFLHSHELFWKLLQCKHQSDLSRSHEACKTRVSDCQPWHMEQSEVGYSVRVSLSVQNKFMAKPWHLWVSGYRNWCWENNRSAAALLTNHLQIIER